MFGLGGMMGGMGGLGGMMGGMGGAAGGAAGAAAGGAGGFMGTLGKIGKGLGTAAQTFSSMGGFTGEGGKQGGTPVAGWQTPAQTGLADEIKKQLALMKQEDIMKRLTEYRPYEDRGGVEGLTINPYR